MNGKPKAPAWVTGLKSCFAIAVLGAIGAWIAWQGDVGQSSVWWGPVNFFTKGIAPSPEDRIMALFGFVLCAASVAIAVASFPRWWALLLIIAAAMVWLVFGVLAISAGC